MMKTTARFTVIHGPLYADRYEVMQQFARLIPASIVQNDHQCWTDLVVQLDVVLDMESNPPGQKTQISTYFTLQLRDIAQKSNVLRSFIEYIRQDLFARVGEFVQKEAEQAAPPMPPEPEPVYIPTEHFVMNQRIALESCGDDQIDLAALEQLNRAVELIHVALRRK